MENTAMPKETSPADKLTLIGIGVFIGWISGFAIGILTGIV